MKNFIFCLAAMLMLAACNNRNESQGNADETLFDQPQTDMQVAGPSEKAESEWAQQTTFMSDKPMVIDFFATWCGPCKQLAPILNVIENNHKGEVIFERIDVDQKPELAAEFNIEAIPTLMFVTPKGEYLTLTGLQDADVIEAKIAEMLRRIEKQN